MKKRLRIISIFSFLIGTSLIFSASYFELFFPAKNAFYLGIFGDIVLAIIRSLGVSLITSTFINLLKFWVESTETLVKHDFINRLTRNEMKDLKEKIEKELYFRYNNHDKDNFYNFFEQELSSLLNECYYKSHNTWIECHVTENYISKTIRKRFEIVNPSRRKRTIKIPFGAEMQRVEQVENNKLYQIKRFSVDSKDYTKEINSRLEISEDCPYISDAYCVKVHTSWDIKVKKQCTVDMVIETIAPLNDVCFSNKVTMPCKKYGLIFILKDSSYQLSWHSFGFMGNHKNKIVEELMDNSLEIGFNDWILPGDGVVVSISKCEKNMFKI